MSVDSFLEPLGEIGFGNSATHTNTSGHNLDLYRKSKEGAVFTKPVTVTAAKNYINTWSANNRNVTDRMGSFQDNFLLGIEITTLISETPETYGNNNDGAFACKVHLGTGSGTALTWPGDSPVTFTYGSTASLSKGNLNADDYTITVRDILKNITWAIIVSISYGGTSTVQHQGFQYTAGNTIWLTPVPGATLPRPVITTGNQSLDMTSITGDVAISQTFTIPFAAVNGSSYIWSVDNTLRDSGATSTGVLFPGYFAACSVTTTIPACVTPLVAGDPCLCIDYRDTIPAVKKIKVCTHCLYITALSINANTGVMSITIAPFGNSSTASVTRKDFEPNMVTITFRIKVFVNSTSGYSSNVITFTVTRSY